jgi:hypothetical protein
MGLKYNRAITAGIIGGVVLAVLAIVALAFQVVLGRFSGLPGGSCCFWLLSLLVMLGVGAFAVYYARPGLYKILDAAVVSLVAGAVAGAIDGVVQVVVSMLSPGYFGSITGLVGYEVRAVICAPVTIICYMIVVAIVAAIGGLVYAALIAKRS